ncbi:MAG: SdrD B-like domain-containing protein [Chloroflexota bacterium]
MGKRLLAGISILVFLYACQSANASTPAGTVDGSTPTLATSTPPPTETPTPQPRLAPVNFGIELEDFPPGVNPLTGRAVQDPSWLSLPAVLVSISNMPVTARPQAGPGFAPWVFELFIGEGTTRFMGVFYGGAPRQIPNVTGGCEVREEIIRPRGEWIGNRVWLDENANGRADDWEVGVGGVCLRLLNAAGREVLAEATTDSNGYYAFDAPTVESIIQFIKPEGYEFTQPNVDDDDRDSDADLATGETRPILAEATASFWDAGLILSEAPSPTPTPAVTGTPPGWYIPNEAYVGPIRSGRLTYAHINEMFPNSCLVYAGAGRGIGEQLNGCELIFGVDATTPNSALLTVTHLRELAEGNVNPRQPVNYAGNLFSDSVPEGGQPATDIAVFYHAYSQSAWRYDPISQTHLRWTDLADGTGTLVAATERLTERQLAFENVIVMFAEHNRVRHLQFDIDLSMGQRGFAWLFRDGQVFKIYWSTVNREWEKQNGLLRPIHFVDGQDDPVVLRPGRTWIHIMTPYSSVTDEGNGQWLAQFVQPYDPKDTPTP